MKLTLVDHDDSFTYNLRHWLKPLTSEVKIISHLDIDKISTTDLLVLSPGPKSPSDYPHVINFLKNKSASYKIFGVCLGLQLMCYSEDIEVLPHDEPTHGKTSHLNILNLKYAHLDNLQVARYHSLYAKNINPSTFCTHATDTKNKIPMWVEHTSKSWMAYQFHPESFLTEKSELWLQVLKEWINK